MGPPAHPGQRGRDPVRGLGEHRAVDLVATQVLDHDVAPCSRSRSRPIRPNPLLKPYRGPLRSPGGSLHHGPGFIRGSEDQHEVDRLVQIVERGEGLPAENPVGERIDGYDLVALRGQVGRNPSGCLAWVPRKPYDGDPMNALEQPPDPLG